MAIPLDENLLLGTAGLIFVPLFIFFVKLLIEIGGIKNRLESVANQMSKYDTAYDYITEVKYNIRDIQRRLDQIERDFRKDRSTGIQGGSPV